MMQSFVQFKERVLNGKRAVSTAVTMGATAVMLAVPSFAVDPPAVSADGVLDGAAFDPLVTSVTGTISALLPKVLVVVGLCVAVGIGISLFRKNAKPGNT